MTAITAAEYREQLADLARFHCLQAEIAERQADIAHLIPVPVGAETALRESAQMHADWSVLLQDIRISGLAPAEPPASEGGPR